MHWTYPEPVLPLDLEREVFERAALQYPEMVPTFMLLCRRIHRWQELLLYRVLDLSQPAVVGYISRVLDSDLRVFLAQRTQERTEQLIQEQRVPDGERTMFLRNTVRHIRLYLPRALEWFHEGESKWQAISRILRFNPSVFELAIQMYSSTVPSREQVLKELRPTRLTLQFNRDYDDEVDPTTPLFLRATHLTLLNTTGSTSHPESWARWTPGLPAMPVLTHLCISDNIARGIFPTALTACSMLEAMVVFWAAEGILRSVERRRCGIDAFADYALSLADDRIVLVTAPFWEQWERGARVGRDLWQRVDDFIRRKRRGEIDVIRYILEI
ncbi:hypothetical protein C8R45DRAFT_628434 [Mycena sanguinolenta]|nr:hypothetical protein C8R45DRAFT_628434 [Mycena sanguinolenta]